MLRAKSATPRPDPLFVFAGGPGSDVTQSQRGYLNAWQQQDRDVVLVSQRGTGGDNRLGCSLAADDTNIQGYLDPLFRDDVFKPCLEELKGKFDLTKYSTFAAADDYNEVRLALGYDRINVTGGSYGTRMALVYMRQHPATVRTAILNGVVPIANKNPLYHAANFDLAIRALFAECAADTECRAAVPNLEAEFRAILARLDSKPAAATVAHPVSNARVGGDAVQGGVSRSASGGDVLRRAKPPGPDADPPRVRRGLRSVRRGRRLERARAPAEAGARTPAVGHVRRGRRPDHRAGDRTRSRARRWRAKAASAASGRCARSGRARRIPKDYGDPVSVDVPTLLLSGTLDPVTPPRWGEEAASHLPRSLHLVVPGAHGVGGPCLAGIQRQFLDAGTTDKLDVSCAAEIKPAKFQLTVGR